MTSPSSHNTPGPASEGTGIIQRLRRLFGSEDSQPSTSSSPPQSTDPIGLPANLVASADTLSELDALKDKLYAVQRWTRAELGPINERRLQLAKEAEALYRVRGES